MKKYTQELDNFYKLYNTKPVSDELTYLLTYLNQLLNLNTIEEISGYYEATKEHNYTLASFEKEIDMLDDDVDSLKARLIECFANLLRRKF